MINTAFSGHKMTVDDLNRRVEIETLKNRLNSRLLTSDLENFDRELCTVLSEVCATFQLESAAVHQISPDGDDRCEVVAVHSPRLEFTALSELTWLLGQLGANRRLILSNLDELPHEAASEKRQLVNCGVQSTVILALDSKAALFADFSSTTVRQWTEMEIDALESIVVILRSAFERQRLVVERELLQEKVHQYQKLEAIGRLTGGIAHDFNNMLVPIIGYADSILADNETESPWKQEVAEIRNAATSAAALTRQLLSFTRKRETEFQPLDLNGEIESIGGMLQRMLGEDIELRVRADRSPCCVLADHSQIQQILMNLCVNARDAMPAGGCITIATVCVPEAGEITLSVSDTGVGMPIEVQERVFDPFFSTKGERGTGLGLSVVVGLVHQHRGKMSVVSKEGDGTEFSIRMPALPISEEERALDAEVAAAHHKASTTHFKTARRILLVEDEPAVMAFIKMALSKKGFEVVAAESCEQAITAFDNSTDNEFDLIFTDAKLPDGTGIDVLEHIYQKAPYIKALISSGYSDDRALVDQARERGVQFLQKPYPLDELFESIDRAMTVEDDSIELAA